MFTRTEVRTKLPPIRLGSSGSIIPTVQTVLIVKSGNNLRDFDTGFQRICLCFSTYDGTTYVRTYNKSFTATSAVLLYLSYYEGFFLIFFLFQQVICRLKD